MYMHTRRYDVVLHISTDQFAFQQGEGGEKCKNRNVGPNPSNPDENQVCKTYFLAKTVL